MERKRVESELSESLQKRHRGDSRFLHEAEAVLRAGALEADMREARGLVEQTEATLDQHGYLDFLARKLADHNESLVLERQTRLLHEKLEEMVQERAVCEMMLTSISEIPNHK